MGLKLLKNRASRPLSQLSQNPEPGIRAQPGSDIYLTRAHSPVINCIEKTMNLSMKVILGCQPQKILLKTF